MDLFPDLNPNTSQPENQTPNTTLTGMLQQFLPQPNDPVSASPATTIPTITPSITPQTAQSLIAALSAIVAQAQPQPSPPQNTNMPHLSQPPARETFTPALPQNPNSTITLTTEQFNRLLDDRIQRQQNRTTLQYQGSFRSPLSREILAAPFPNIRLPHLKTYSGNTDPRAHIDQFQHTMLVLTADDSALCKIFPQTLADSAQIWFRNLPSHCIQNFEQFSDMFVAKFVAAIRPNKVSADLNLVHQEKGESLRAYVEKFNDVAMDIQNLNLEVAINALIRNTRC